MWVFKHIYTKSKGLVNAKVRAVIVKESYKAINQNKFTLITYLDIKKAFNIVNQNSFNLSKKGRIFNTPP